MKRVFRVEIERGERPFPATITGVMTALTNHYYQFSHKDVSVEDITPEEPSTSVKVNVDTTELREAIALAEKLILLEKEIATIKRPCPCVPYCPTPSCPPYYPYFTYTTMSGTSGILGTC